MLGCDPDRDYSHLKRKIPFVHVSSCVLVDENDKMLITQRPENKSMSGLWEFPGGKIENGEIPEIAVVRELQEELDIKTSPSCLLPFNFVSHRYDDFHLIMFLFVCRKWKGVVVGKEGQLIKWIPPKELVRYEMPAANMSLIASVRDI